MYKIKVTNIIKNKIYTSEFETQQLANDWLNDQLSNNSFGNSAISLYEVPEGKEALVINSQLEYVNSEMPELGTRTRYDLKAEYEITGPYEVLLNDNTEDARELRLQDAINKAMMWDKYYNAGAMVKKYFTFLINTRPITSSQKNSIQAMPEILAIDEQLKFGRLLQAKALAQALVADETLIYQADIDAVCLFIDDMVGSM